MPADAFNRLGDGSSTLNITAVSEVGHFERSGGPDTCLTHQKQLQQKPQEQQQQPPTAPLIDSMLASLFTQHTVPIDALKCEEANVNQLIIDAPQQNAEHENNLRHKSRQGEEVCWKEAEDQVMMLALQSCIQKDPIDVNTLIGRRIGMLLPKVSG